ncbi:MAG: hypothetical protein CL816_03840 [Coxiellaceae bacterium]|nr:hypothetical protein [Coxiellaceae bacterium]|tara:strand:- start:8182 stop:9033 length:852 start_codon:yes stop_codon:yes gene_type:complete
MFHKSEITIGLYLTPECLYAKKIQQSPRGTVTHHEYHALPLDSASQSLSEALSLDPSQPGRYLCHITISHHYTHQQIIELEIPIPERAIVRYLEHVGESLFQHPWDTLYYDYHRMASEKKDRVYFISVCKQTLIQQRILKHLPGYCQFISLQPEWLIGLHLIAYVSTKKQSIICVLYCDSNHLIHYTFSSHQLLSYEVITLTHDPVESISIVEDYIRAHITMDGVYVITANRLVRHQLLDSDEIKCQLIPIEDTLPPSFQSLGTEEAFSHAELMTTLTALTPR